MSESMKKVVGITDFLSRKFQTYPISGQFADALGEPEKNFKAIVYGHPGNGKTEFCMQLVKHMAQFTKVYYNSFEQGISKTLQDCLIRNNMSEVSGRVMFGDKDDVQDMHRRLKGKNSPQVVIIDSRDYMNLTAEQFKSLTEANPRKAFIIVCWESAQRPKGEYAKAIEYMCDMKIRIYNFKAYPRSRFGGNKTYTIWDRKEQVGGQKQLEL